MTAIIDTYYDRYNELVGNEMPSCPNYIDINSLVLETVGAL